MNHLKIDILAYKHAHKYLESFKGHGVTKELIDKYLELPKRIGATKTTIKDIYLRILESAQNANMKAGVVGGSIGGIKQLSIILNGFDPKYVKKKYESDDKKLLNDIVNKLNPRGKIRRTSRAIWPKYCQTVLSAAEFLSGFKSGEEFFKWTDFFDSDDRARPALPMLLSREIKGMGFALSCDFLKEIGYLNFGKPDVHITDIFKGLELSQEKADDYQIFKDIIRIAKNNKVTPYNVDKLFWLIGSGYFYEDKHLGKNGRINAINKIQFISKTSKIIKELKVDSKKLKAFNI